MLLKNGVYGLRRIALYLRINLKKEYINLAGIWSVCRLVFYPLAASQQLDHEELATYLSGRNRVYGTSLIYMGLRKLDISYHIS